MSTSSQEDQNFKSFIEAWISRQALEEVIEWIGDNLKPEDVFGVAKLNAWAFDNDFRESREEPDV